ncbi:hypothetical protein A3731_28355 [Roseovarius sp. HI0049]|nr:hypothetical protein A3731_28355 [Roseovarius sp. HI0049]
MRVVPRLQGIPLDAPIMIGLGRTRLLAGRAAARAARAAAAVVMAIMAIVVAMMGSAVIVIAV